MYVEKKNKKENKNKQTKRKQTKNKKIKKNKKKNLYDSLVLYLTKKMVKSVIYLLFSTLYTLSDS